MVDVSHVKKLRLILVRDQMIDEMLDLDLAIP